jgi:hypothetical protein
MATIMMTGHGHRGKEFAQRNLPARGGRQQQAFERLSLAFSTDSIGAEKQGHRHTDPERNLHDQVHCVLLIEDVELFVGCCQVCEQAE